MNDDFLPLSALQHHSYCPRQFALIHVERAWEENRFTAEGRLLHERVDSGVAEQRKGVRFERAVSLISHRYKLTGKMDLLEVVLSEPPQYFPVEYKRGKPKVENWDRIQVCAQALCIEEMRGVDVGEGAIWYWESRQRETIVIDDALRQETIQTIAKAHELILSGKTPPPIDDKRRCRACSLVELCGPDIFRRDHSRRYVDSIYTQMLTMDEVKNEI